MKRFLILLITIITLNILSFGTVFSFAEESEENTLTEQTVLEEAQADEEITVDKVKGVKAKGISSKAIKVTWKEVKDADGYKVLRYSKSKDKYVVIKTIKSGETTKYTNKSLQGNTKKSYKVQAYVLDDGNKITGTKSEKAVGKTKKSGVQKVMGIAKSKLGCSYVSGAAGPNAFDCSGFVYYVYKNSNASKVKFSRSSAQGIYSQIKKYDIGSTSLSKAKKGDILFFGSSKGNIWHTGIYYGDKKEIHAFSTWGRVAVTPVSMSTSNKKLVAIVRLPMKE